MEKRKVSSHGTSHFNRLHREVASEVKCTSMIERDLKVCQLFYFVLYLESSSPEVYYCRYTYIISCVWTFL